MTFRMRGSIAAAALAGATWAVSAVAADVAPVAAATTGDAQAATTATPAASAGLRVFRDPSTGQLRAPTDEEMKLILEEERAQRAARGEVTSGRRGTALAVQRHSNGMRSAVLGPAYRVTLQADRAADGKVAISHANGQPNAQQLPTE